VIESRREEELRTHKFFAALKGINLDEAHAKEADKRVRQIKDRVAAQQRGENPEEFELREYFGTDYEIEEEASE
jgi:hypothetical protein